MVAAQQQLFKNTLESRMLPMDVIIVVRCLLEALFTMLLS